MTKLCSLNNGIYGTHETVIGKAVTVKFGNVNVKVEATFDAEYSTGVQAFWLRVDNSTDTLEALMTENAWRYNSKRRLAWVHKVDDDSILFLGELGVDAMKYAPVKQTKSVRTASTVTTPTVPMTKAKDGDKVMDARANMTPVERAKLALKEAEAEEKAAKALEAKRIADEKAAQALPASIKAMQSPNVASTSLAEWDNAKLEAKIDEKMKLVNDTLASIAVLVKELNSRK